MQASQSARKWMEMKGSYSFTASTARVISWVEMPGLYSSPKDTPQAPSESSLFSFSKITACLSGVTASYQSRPSLSRMVL